MPRGEIASYLEELQGLVSALRRWRDDLKVPKPDEVRPLLSPRLLAHPELTAAYLRDARYRAVVEEAMGSAAAAHGEHAGDEDQ